MISVFPRLFIGIAAWGAYHGTKKLCARLNNKVLIEAISCTAAGVVAPVVNTGLVFLMIWAFYGGGHVFGTRTVQVWFVFLLGANFPWEIGITAVAAAPVIMALKKALKTALPDKNDFVLDNEPEIDAEKDNVISN
jgi:uncharacterized membrane protein